MMGWLSGSALASAFTGNPLPLMLANAGKDFEAVLAWLARDGWRIVSLILAILLAYQTVTKAAEQRHSSKLQKQLINATGELEKRAAESKVQQKTNGTRIDHYITVEKPVIRTRVERVETAPLPGNCRDPQEVLDADI